jgi:hypothetical protein
MTGTKKEPQQALNKVFMNIPPDKTEFELFKKNLNTLISHFVDTESEEHIKTLLRDFLKDTFYKSDYYVNTKGRADLVIHGDSSGKSPVSVLFEIKKPTNKSEMITAENLNCKAFHETVLYFLRERIEHKNIDLKHIIITNLFEWFIFDAADFERLFIHSSVKTEYEKWNKKELISSKTDLFYNEIIKPFVENSDEIIDYVHFNLKNLPNFQNPSDFEKELIPTFKILSPKNLLKQFYINDNNTLNKDFYFELLHIVGLEEFIEGGKPIIKQQKEKIPGTLIENTISQIKIRNDLNKIETLESYGDTEAEQLFNVALELNITWINRILFLKLLESQLIAFHGGNSEYNFLHNKRIANFGQLEKIFFQVLAKKIHERDPKINEQYAHIPYLNSSLFEPSDLEKQSIFISQLDSDSKIPFFKTTILKDTKGNKRTGECDSLQYLLEFLDAYNFTSEPSAVFYENTNTLINAAVLGLIFEKINGYKEGAFFTPGYITMYMCRETIRRAVVDKFRNSNFQDFQNLENFDDLYNKIDKIPIEKSNEIIDNIKICDPSVGSGHFLVSALNEMICVKADLEILCDKNNKRIRNYKIENVRDELEIKDTDGKWFRYVLNSENIPFHEHQRIQETIFHEKQKIIENCLFGVDINPNSVNICRLRLWIELLKHAYYKADTNYSELETLPNIDINIKCGNSLISRFDLKDDISRVFNGSGFTFKQYKEFHELYRNETKDKKLKKSYEQQINQIKDKFKVYIRRNHPLQKKLDKLKQELFDNYLTPKLDLIELTDEQKKKQTNEMNLLNGEILMLENELDELRVGKLYLRAFEWRYEFPEVLNLDNGDFIGFDVVVGNPPYGRFKPTDKEDLFLSFINRCHLTSNKTAYVSLIVPSSWITSIKYTEYRKTYLAKYQFLKLINLPFDVFDHCYVDTSILVVKKELSNTDFTLDVFAFDKKFVIDKHIDFDLPYNQIKMSDIEQDKNFKILFNPFLYELNKRFQNSEKFISLGEISTSTIGLLLSKYEISDTKVKKYYPLFLGNVNRYTCEISEKKYVDMSKHKIEYLNHYFNSPKIWIRRIVNRKNRIMCTIPDENMIVKKDIYPFTIFNKDFDIKYILAILNSKLISYLYLNNSTISTKDDFRQTTLTELRDMPIPVISVSKQKPLISLVEKLMQNVKKSKETQDFENKLDELIYKLFQLSESEISTIENAKI